MSDWSSEVCSSDLARIRMHTVLLTPVILLARALPKPCRRTSSTARRFALLYRAPLYCSPLPGGGSGALSRAFRSARYLRRCSETHAALTPKRHRFRTEERRGGKVCCSWCIAHESPET